MRIKHNKIHKIHECAHALEKNFVNAILFALTNHLAIAISALLDGILGVEQKSNDPHVIVVHLVLGHSKDVLKFNAHKSDLFLKALFQFLERWGTARRLSMGADIKYL